MPDPTHPPALDRDCPYCFGTGCTECGQTGKWVTTFIDAGDGMTARIRGNAELSPESVEALTTVIRAAYAHLAATTPQEARR